MQQLYEFFHQHRPILQWPWSVFYTHVHPSRHVWRTHLFPMRSYWDPICTFVPKSTLMDQSNHSGLARIVANSTRPAGQPDLSRQTAQSGGRSTDIYSGKGPFLHRSTAPAVLVSIPPPKNTFSPATQSLQGHSRQALRCWSKLNVGTARRVRGLLGSRLSRKRQVFKTPGARLNENL